MTTNKTTAELYADLTNSIQQQLDEEFAVLLAQSLIIGINQRRMSTDTCFKDVVSIIADDIREYLSNDCAHALLVDIREDLSAYVDLKMEKMRKKGKREGGAAWDT